MRRLLLGFPVIFAGVVGCRPTIEPDHRLSTAGSEVVAALVPTGTPGTAAALRRRTPGGPDVITRVVPTPTPTPRARTPTPEPDYVATITSIEEPITLSTTESPDGNWRTEVIRYECVGAQYEEKAYEELILVDLRTQAKDTVDTQLTNCGGLGAAGLAGLFWSPSSSYFYYTDGAYGWPDGCGFWSRPYLYFCVANRHVAEIGGGERSPDGRMIAAWQGRQGVGTDQARLDLVIWDIDHGELMRFPAARAADGEDSDLGQIVWSPTNTGVAYLQSTWVCYQPGGFSLTLIDLTERRQTLLLRADEPTIEAVTWTLPGQMTLFDTDSTEWVYTLTDHELRVATPVAIPRLWIAPR